MVSKDIISAMIDSQTKHVVDATLVDFTKGFYDRIAASNPDNTTFARDQFDRRLDSMARLLVGDEVCAAVAFDGSEIQVATNRAGHSEDRIKTRIAILIKHDPLAVDQYQFFPVLYVSTNHNAEEVRFVSDKSLTYFYSARANGLKLADGQNPNFQIKLTAAQHLIPFVGEASVGMTGDFKPFLHILKEEYMQAPDFEMPTTVMLDTPYNSLQRRAEQLVQHMTKVAVLANCTDESQKDKCKELVDNSNAQILMNGLCWEAARWYKKYNPFPGQYLDSKKSKLDEFLGQLNKDFSEFRAHHPNIKGKVTLVSLWLESVEQKIKDGTIDAPEYVKQSKGGKDGIDLFLSKAQQYFVDIEKLDNFVAHEFTQNTQFAQWLLAHGGPQGDAQHVVRVVDELPDNAHAELRILFDYLSKHKQLDYVATSLLCCAHCKLVMDGYGIEDISGMHARAYPNWYVPLDEFSTIDPNFLLKFLGQELHEKYLALGLAQQQLAIAVIHEFAKISAENLVIIGCGAPIWNPDHIIATESDDEDAGAAPSGQGGMYYVD